MEVVTRYDRVIDGCDSVLMEGDGEVIALHDRALLNASGAFSVHADGEGRVNASGFVTATLRDSASLIAAGDVSAFLYDDAECLASDESSITAHGRSRVDASGRASAVLEDEAFCSAVDSVAVTATDESVCRVEGRAIARARGRATVYASGHALVFASGCSFVRARGFAVVHAAEDATVVAGRNVLVVTDGSPGVTVRQASVEGVRREEDGSAEDWAAVNAVPVADGRAVLYAAVSDGFMWRDRTEVCSDDDDVLSPFCAEPADAAYFAGGLPRVLACRVRLADLREQGCPGNPWRWGGPAEIV